MRCADGLRAADQLIDVDAEIAEVLAERPQADMGVGDVVALAEFDEAAERTQARNRALHRLAGKTIEHDVDAAAGDRATSSTKFGRARDRAHARRRAPRSRSRLACEPAVAMIRAPRDCAIWMAAMPTPPAPPWMSTHSLRFRLASVISE